MRQNCSDKELIKITKDSLIQSSRQDRIKLIAKMVNSFFQEINLAEDVAFTRVGSMEANHGAAVKSAYHTLKALNDLEGLASSNINDMTDNQLEIKCRSLYKNYIEKRAPYVDGINKALRALSGDNSFDINQIRKKLNEKDLLRDGNNPLNKDEKKEFINVVIHLYNQARHHLKHYSPRAAANKQPENETISAKYNDGFINLVSENFGKLFDFKHDSHRSKENATEVLGKVTARHLVCMYQAFNALKLLPQDTREEIENKFIAEEIMQKQGWGAHDKNTIAAQEELLALSDIKNLVDKYANLRDFKMKSSETQSVAQPKYESITPDLTPNMKYKSKVKSLAI